MSKNEVTEAIKLSRINRIIELMNAGLRMGEITFILVDEWKCHSRSVDKYIKFAKLELRKHYQSKGLDDLLANYDDLYKKAISQGDNKLAKSIIDSKGKFTVGEKSNVEHSGDLGITVIKLNGPKENNNEQ